MHTVKMGEKKESRGHDPDNRQSGIQALKALNVTRQGTF